MKKIMTLAAVAALVLSACAKIETIETNEAITFGAYSGNAVTKAGTAGEMTTTSLQTPGFGVFAYQTTNAGYSSSATPNFMYNTRVYGASWTYNIIKYWPNQIANGGTDSQTPDKAQAYSADKVSFFAYGPYEAHSNASTGAVTDASYGIVGFTGNAATGDPKVSYKVSNDLTKQVDLIWGVSKGETWTNVAGGTNTPTDGFPYLDLQKPAIGTAIKFYFRHALAQIKLQAVGAFNETTAGGTKQNATKVTIEKVVLTLPGMPQTGVLNLNNTAANTPEWESVTGSSNMTLTISGDNLNTVIKDTGAKTAASMTNAGVTTTPTDVIVDGKYYTMLPKGTSTTVNVEVTYYVTTDDADLNGGYSRVKNVISHDVAISKLDAGTKNTIKMILGLSEVKFDVSVEDWTVGVSGEVNLPINS